MTKKHLKLGLCTGGGDCPGLNAAIRAVVRTAVFNHGFEVLGVRYGLTGLLHPESVKPLTLNTVDPILNAGGTILGTNNQGSPFRNPAEADEMISRIRINWRKLKLDGMIVIGGDGTQFMGKHLSMAGFPVIGIPKTIDNDLVGTDQTIGFATAVDIATDAACRLGTSAEAHDRIMILEVMGRDGGHIALATGIASGANAVLIPEIPYSQEALFQHYKRHQKSGRNHFLIIVAEGATAIGGEQMYNATAGNTKVLGGVGSQVARDLHAASGVDSRVAVLGHVQRGGAPNAADRLLATTFGARAVELAAAGEFGGIVGIRAGKLVTIPYGTLTDKRRMLGSKDPMIITAEATGISLGR
jgi:6-phosphofructokinase 1